LQQFEWKEIASTECGKSETGTGENTQQSLKMLLQLQA
jgi:hypothetical protein